VSSGASSDVGDAGVVVRDGKKRGRIFLGCVGTLGDGCTEVMAGSGGGGVKSGNAGEEPRRTEAGLVGLGVAVSMEADLAVDKTLQTFSAAARGGSAWREDSLSAAVSGKSASSSASSLKLSLLSSLSSSLAVFAACRRRHGRGSLVGGGEGLGLTVALCRIPLRQCGTARKARVRATRVHCHS
jgi:hypothetical protein